MKEWRDDSGEQHDDAEEYLTRELQRRLALGRSDVVRLVRFILAASDEYSQEAMMMTADVTLGWSDDELTRYALEVGCLSSGYDDDEELFEAVREGRIAAYNHD